MKQVGVSVEDFAVKYGINLDVGSCLKYGVRREQDKNSSKRSGH
jgi:hypothetical protein